MTTPYIYPKWSLRYAEEAVRRYGNYRERLALLEEEAMATALKSPTLSETGIAPSGYTSNSTMHAALKLAGHREYLQLSLAVGAVDATLRELTTQEAARVTAFYWRSEGPALSSAQRRKVLNRVAFYMGLPTRDSKLLVLARKRQPQAVVAEMADAADLKSAAS